MTNGTDNAERLRRAIARGAVGVTIVVGTFLGLPRLGAQTPPPRASFDVASIKPNHSADARVQILGRPGQFVATNVTIQLLVQQAFRIQNFQIVGAPAWLSTDRYDINAKIPADGGQQNEMLQSLLIERMKLTAHNETREMPVYALVLARADGRLGPNLKKSEIDCNAPRGGGPGRGPGPLPDGPPPGSARQAGPGPLPGNLQCGARFGLGQFNASGMSIDQLATNLSRSLNRVVINRTGLPGGFDIDLTWTPDPGQGAGPLGALPPQLGPGGPPAPAPDGPSIFTAVQEQLGLKLDSQRGPVEVLVIDSIEQPTPD